jgi:hypothetical protein
MKLKALLGPSPIMLVLSDPIVRAQVLSYTTSVVTKCFGSEPPTSQIGMSSDIDRSPLSTVACSMPQCIMCVCPSCTHASVFTTTLGVFCPTGLSSYPYTITETYVGMRMLPHFATPTLVPYGFTTAVKTCTACGASCLSLHP